MDLSAALIFIYKIINIWIDVPMFLKLYNFPIHFIVEKYNKNIFFSLYKTKNIYK